MPLAGHSKTHRRCSAAASVKRGKGRLCPFSHTARPVIGDNRSAPRHAAGRRARAAPADTYGRARSIRAANLEPGQYPGYG
jgi:hypothetical protein